MEYILICNYQYIMANQSIIIFGKVISILFGYTLIDSSKIINLIAEMLCLFDYITSKILANIIIINDHWILYSFIIKIKLALFYQSKLLLILRNTANKNNNIIKFNNKNFFLPNTKLIFYICYKKCTIHLHNKRFFIFFIEKKPVA